MNETIVVIDFETTGLSPSKGARVTEVAAVRVVGDSIADSFQSLMNAGEAIPQEIQRITGITTDMVRQAPSVASVMRQLDSFLGDATLLVAHNSKFDESFLTAEYGRVGIKCRAPFACSVKLAMRVYPNSPNHKLATLLDYADIPHTGQHHRALADATATANLWLQMRRDLNAIHRIKLRHEQLRKLTELPPDNLARTLDAWR